jgi:hypothetical protein
MWTYQQALSVIRTYVEVAYGGVPSPIAAQALAVLDDRLRNVVVKFREYYRLAV